MPHTGKISPICRLTVTNFPSSENKVYDFLAFPLNKTSFVNAKIFKNYKLLLAPYPKPHHCNFPIATLSTLSSMAELHPVIILLLAVTLFLGSSDGIELQKKVSNVRKLAGATDPNDVKGLAALVLQFEVLTLISGSDDPCLPIEWTWINCSTDASPRVTALYLSSQNLVGFLPDFSTMDALVTIDLDQNFLTGTIPSFLGTFPNLKELNLSSNLFTGQVPDSIIRNTKLNTDLSGNPDLSYQTPGDINSPNSGGSLDNSPNSGGSLNNSPNFGGTSDPETTSINTTGKKKSKLPVIIGSAVPVFVVFWVVVGVFAVFRHKAKTAAAVAQAVAAAGAGQYGGANKPSDMTEETPINAQSAAANL
ncbi:hypothetical protein ACH5RR_020861 [Cinchona calisaya]|uniref:Leucine-rich repeat-containing N-terminal plant-type domain-containing protein n=1 Tax=Cinchona calisaya TaxID=153742 RepID=A0ABD2ZIN1_9GENT